MGHILIIGQTGFQFEIVKPSSRAIQYLSQRQQMLLLAIIPLPAGLSCLSTHEQLWQLWETQLLFPVNQHWNVHVPLIWGRTSNTQEDCTSLTDRGHTT